MTGKLVVLEGGEGAGKGTAIERLKLILPPDTVFTREPGGTPEAEEIRLILKDKDLDPLTQLLLFFGIRADHYHKVIRPALMAGRHVVSDRLDGSTYAYQVWAGSEGFLHHEFLQLRRLVGDPGHTCWLRVILGRLRFACSAVPEKKGGTTDGGPPAEKAWHREIVELTLHVRDPGRVKELATTV